MIGKLFPTPRQILVLWNTASQGIGKIFSAGITFLMSIVIARSFGTQGYGDFTKITTFVAVFYLLSDFGINAVFLQQDQLADGQQKKDPWSTLLGLRIVGSIFLMFVCLAILVFVPQGQRQGYTSLVKLGIILFIPTILFQALLTTANALFQKHLRYDLSTLAVTVGGGVSLLLVVFAGRMLTLSSGVLFVTAALVAGSLIGVILAFFFVQRFHALTVAFSFRESWELLSLSVPLGITLICTLIYFRADSFILTLTRSTEEVGLYGLAYKIFEFPLAFPTFFMNAVYPLLLQAKGDAALFERSLKRSFFFLSSTSFVALVGLWLLAPLLPLVRPEFAGSVWSLRVLSLSMPFFFLSSLTMWALIARGKQILLLVIYLISMMCNVVLDIWFIPSFGFIAASWITVVSEGAVLLVSGFFVLRLFNQPSHGKIEQSNI